MSTSPNGPQGPAQGQRSATAGPAPGTAAAEPAGKARAVHPSLNALPDYPQR